MSYYKELGKYKNMVEVIWIMYIMVLIINYILFYTLQGKGIDNLTFLIVVIPVSVIFLLEFKISKIKKNVFTQYEQRILAETNEESMGTFKKDGLFFGRTWSQRRKLNKFYRVKQELSNDEYISYLINEYNENKV